MPIINAQGGVFREWEGLLNACRSHAALLPNSDNMRVQLEDLLRQAREVKAQQEEHEGRRQLATQQLGGLIEQGQEVSRRLRGFAKAHLGTKSELLVQFGTSPIRRRSRKREAPEVKDAE
jgi:hypothetical protein